MTETKPRASDHSICVVSAGPGAPGGMTIAAREAIQNATRVYASKRHSALIAPPRYRPLEPLGDALSAIRADWANGQSVAVVVSGDAGLFSMLPMLTRAFGKENLHVIPGVSAMQALCAKLGEPWQNARILSAHGRPLSDMELAQAVRAHESTLLFCDARHNPAWIAESLMRAGLYDTEIAVGERLDASNERIMRLSVSEASQMRFDELCMVRVYNPRPVSEPCPIGLSDDAFARGQTPMTKKEIRVLAIAALKLRADAVVWDVGAGTGSVSVECARICPRGRVFAVERDAEALHLIEQNRALFRLLNLEIVPGAAPGALCNLPKPTHVFLGGTGGEMPAIVDMLMRMPGPIRLVGTAVTVESTRELIEMTKNWENVEITQIAVSRIEKAGAYHMYKALNPVVMLSADWEGENQ